MAQGKDYHVQLVTIVPQPLAVKPEARRGGWHRSWLTAFALVVASTMATSAAASPPSVRRSLGAPAVSFPGTPVGKQARWLVRALAHLPIPTAEITAHFDRAYLALVPAPAAAALNASFVGLHNLRVDSITTSTTSTILFVVTVNGKAEWDVRIEVDSKGLIRELHAQPVGSSPASVPAPPSPTATTPTTTKAMGAREFPSGWVRHRSGGR